MTSRSGKSLPVTDHAALRYLERVAGLDVERVKAGIWREVHHAVKAGASKITVDGFEYRISGGRVVTVVAAEDACEPAIAFAAWDQGHDEGEPQS